MAQPPNNSAAEAVPTKGWSPWRPRIIAAAGAIVLAAGLMEGVVRVGGLGPKVYRPRAYEPAGVPFVGLQVDSVVIPVYRPNSVFASVYDPSGDTRGYFGPEGRVVYRLNKWGLRGGPLDVEKAPGTRRVICLGDSFTFGEGVFEEHTYPQQLERLLTAAMPLSSVEVINAGVQGYGTREEAAIFQAYQAKFRPDLVILGYFLNDATDFAETIRQNDEMTRAFEPSGVARISKAWEIVQRRCRAATMQAEYFESIHASLASKQWEASLDSIKALQRVAMENRFRFIVMIFPVLWDLDSWYPFAAEHARINATLKAERIDTIDLLDVFRGMPASSLWVHPTDHHPNELAQRLAAEAIAEHLQRADRMRAAEAKKVPAAPTAQNVHATGR